MISEEEKEILRKADEIRIREELEHIEAGEAESGSFYSVPKDAQNGNANAANPNAANPNAVNPNAGNPYAVDPQNPTNVPPNTGLPRPVYEEEPEPPKKKKKKKHHFFLKLLLILLILLALLFVYLFVVAGNAEYKPFDPIAEDPAWNLPASREQGVFNVLLIGTDARVTDNDCRSDSIILMSVCPKQRKIYLTSILRDSYVPIPGVGMNRINMAYQYGNAKLLAETVEMNFHVRIDKYMRVDFYSFIEIIDALGGVDIDVTDEEVHWVNYYLSEINQLIGVDPDDSMITEGGHLHLNGKQALAYSRIRYIGTDFARTDRQRTVLMAVKTQVQKHPFKAIGSLWTVYGAVSTDMNRLELASYSFISPVLMFFKVEMGRIPYDGTWWNDTMGAGGEVLGLDLGANTATLRRNIYGEGY